MNITSRGAAVEAAITIASGGQLVKRDAGLTSAGVAVASCTGAGDGVGDWGEPSDPLSMSFSYFSLYRALGGRLFQPHNLPAPRSASQ
ncbi:hypothetical protein C5H21_08400 [Xylella fastidiosa]|nr:hypothetical protein C5H21_08400 [Xylella fastidiosa]